MTSSAPAQNKKAKRMVPLRYVLTPFAILIAAIVLFAIFAALAPKPEKKPINIKAPLVAVTDIQRKDVRFQIASQGSVMPRTETTLISEVSGVVTQVSDKFLVGGYFKQGETLLTIDDISYQVALLKAQARLDAATAKLVEEQARHDQARDEWSLTGKSYEDAPILALRTPQLQQAKADLLAAEADIKEAKIKLSRTKILAPYDAMLKEKKVDVGQYVTIGSQLAVTFAVDYAEVRLPIKHRDIDFLNLPRINLLTDDSSKVELYFNLLGEKHSWQSSLARYEGVVDRKSRVHYVVAQVDDPYDLKADNGHEEIRIGTFVNANIEGRLVENAVAIPRSALQGTNSINMVDRENKLQISKINVLYADSDFAYTLDELDSSQRIVLTKLEAPVVGMKLRVEGEQQAQEETVNTETGENGDKTDAQGGR